MKAINSQCNEKKMKRQGAENFPRWVVRMRLGSEWDCSHTFPLEKAFSSQANVNIMQILIW